MYLKVAINTVLFSFLSILQISFVGALPSFFGKVNLVMIILVFILSFFSFRLSLLWALGCGIIFDIYSFSVFGTYSFLFVLVIVMANFLYINFFTNLSLYSCLALYIFSVLMFKFLLYFSNFVFAFFEIQDSFVFGSMENFFKTLLFELFLVFVFFYVFNYFSKNFKTSPLYKYGN